jgi:Cytochrome C assembly protein.
MLAIIYVVRGVFTRSLKNKTADSLARMTYGVVCFATLFSFVGTVLGGIWADQSWGRSGAGIPKKTARC